MDKIQLTIIPGYRISSNNSPEIRLKTNEACTIELQITKNGDVISKQMFELKTIDSSQSIFPVLKSIRGQVVFNLIFYNNNGIIFERLSFNYEVIETSCSSNTLIDGCWISIYHWSEDEARWFNKNLCKLTDEDWKKQIYDMNNIGINGIIVQNMFYCNEYAGKHNMTTETYDGYSLYPSKLYGKSYDIAARDALEAILTAADERGMNVFVGVGLFAWFDFSPQSLQWHINVTNELFSMYGHHKSLYGWYISEEIFGSLYFDYDFVENDKYKEIVKFFQEYKAFVEKITPTKPVALAPNNIRFHHYEKEWKEILANVDILLPFAFARDPENLNIIEINNICKATNTHFWVDMEMFNWPLDNGLVPKTFNDLVKEIRTYDDVEQIYGYQYTGIMNSPDNKLIIGINETVELYKEYEKYYNDVIK